MDQNGGRLWPYLFREGRRFYLRGEFAGTLLPGFKIFGVSNGEKAAEEGRGKAFLIEERLPVMYTFRTKKPRESNEEMEVTDAEQILLAIAKLVGKQLHVGS